MYICLELKYITKIKNKEERELVLYNIKYAACTTIHTYRKRTICHRNCYDSFIFALYATTCVEFYLILLPN